MVNDVNDDIEEVSEVHLFYGIGLIIRHPSIDPKIITTELRLIPHRYWRAGSRCSTPIGTPLVGLWKNSFWSWWLDCKGKKAFFESICELLIRLEPHREFLSNLVLSDGEIALGIQLPGKSNIGDVLDWQSMEKMVSLKINLEIEVFPDWNPSWSK